MINDKWCINCRWRLADKTCVVQFAGSRTETEDLHSCHKFERVGRKRKLNKVRNRIKEGATDDIEIESDDSQDGQEDSE